MITRSAHRDRTHRGAQFPITANLIHPTDGRISDAIYACFNFDKIVETQRVLIIGLCVNTRIKVLSAFPEKPQCIKRMCFRFCRQIEKVGEINHTGGIGFVKSNLAAVNVTHIIIVLTVASPIRTQRVFIIIHARIPPFFIDFNHVDPFCFVIHVQRKRHFLDAVIHRQP